MKKHEKQIEEEKLTRVPASFDLTPYRDEKDFSLLQRLVRQERAGCRASFGATNASPCDNTASYREGRGNASPLRRSPKFVGGDACAALQPPPCVSKEGEAMPRRCGDLLNP
jgi:hypothetical protein